MRRIKYPELIKVNARGSYAPACDCGCVKIEPRGAFDRIRTRLRSTENTLFWLTRVAFNVKNRLSN